MEHSAWTDARLDDRFDQIDRRFDRLDRDIGELRSEVRDGFADQRSLTIRLHLGTLIPVLGLVAAVLVRGA
jgi:hypothetical protein